MIVSHCLYQLLAPCLPPPPLVPAALLAPFPTPPGGGPSDSVLPWTSIVSSWNLSAWVYWTAPKLPSSSPDLPHTPEWSVDCRLTSPLGCWHETSDSPVWWNFVQWCLSQPFYLPSGNPALCIARSENSALLWLLFPHPSPNLSANTGIAPIRVFPLHCFHPGLNQLNVLLGLL